MGIELSNPDAYRQKMFDSICNQDPLQIIQETPAKLQQIVTPFSTEQLQSHPFPGKWSPLEIIGHYVDVEWNFGIRLRFALCEDNPPFIGYNQDLWVERLQHNAEPPQMLLERFSSIRAMNILFYQSLTPGQMQRYGTHNERGKESIETMLKMEAGHDLHHIKQLQTYLAAISS